MAQIFDDFIHYHGKCRQDNKCDYSKLSKNKSLYLSLAKIQDKHFYDLKRIKDYRLYFNKFTLTSRVASLPFNLVFLVVMLAGRLVNFIYRLIKEVSFKKSINHVEQKKYLAIGWNDEKSIRFIESILEEGYRFDYFSNKNKLLISSSERGDILLNLSLGDAILGFFLWVKCLYQVLAFKLPIQRKIILALGLNELIFDFIKIEKIVAVSGVKKVIGPFDSFSSIDFITDLFKNKGVDTICTPHGIAFQEKVHYISKGVQLYFLWSEFHRDYVEKSLIDKAGKFVISGAEHISNFKPCIEMKRKKKSSRKTILVVGEYYPNDFFYSSPFNSAITIQIFNVLRQHKGIEFKVRARSGKENYSSTVSEFVGNNIAFVSSDEDLRTQIIDSDYVLSIFSNVIHEALALRIPVIQPILFNFPSYRYLDRFNLTHVASNKYELMRMLKLIEARDEPFKKVDYLFHEKYFLNNFEYKCIKEYL